MKALVIDDSRAMRAIIVGMLRDAGWEASEAADGEEALGALRRSAADLAVVDWHLPGMSGPEIVRAIRAESAWSEIRILMVTTEVDPERIREALEAGAQEYLMKPFTAEHMKDKLALMGLGTS